MIKISLNSPLSKRRKVSNDDFLIYFYLFFLGLIKRHKSAGRPQPQSTGNDAYHLVRNDRPSTAHAQASCSYTYVRPPVASSSQHHQSSLTRLSHEAQHSSKSVDHLANHKSPFKSSVTNSKPTTILINPNFKKVDTLKFDSSTNCTDSANISVSNIPVVTNNSTVQPARPKTILVNPNFKGPSVKPPSIHINSNFFNAIDVPNLQHSTEISTKTNAVNNSMCYSVPSTSTSSTSDTGVQKYSLKTNRKLVRDNIKPPIIIAKNTPSLPKNPLIAINKRKLVRMSTKSEKVISEIKVHRIPFKKSNTILYKNKKSKLDKRSLVFNKSSVKNVYKLKKSPKTLQAPTNSTYKFVRGGKSKSPNTSKFRLDHRLPQSRIKNVKKYSLKYESNTTPRRRSWQNAMLPLKQRTPSSSKIYRYRKSSVSSQGKNKRKVLQHLI